MTTSVTVKSTKPPIKLISERSGITLVIDRSITTTTGGGGGSGTVTNVSASAPLSVTSPTTTPVITISPATTSAAGSMSAANVTKLNSITSGATYQARMESQVYIGSAGLVGYGLNVGQYASTPDSAALDIVGDIEITARMQPTSWTLGSNQGIVGKRSIAANYSYWTFLTAGRPSIAWTTDGTTVKTAACLTAVPFTTEAGWVRITFDVDNGASGSTATFYTAADSATEPTSWTPLGATVVTAGTTSIFSGTSNVEFGSNLLGGNQVVGVLKRAIIRSSIGGTVVCDADFEAAQDDCLAFTETANGAAVSISTTNRYTYGVPNATFVTTAGQSMSANQTHYMPFEVTASTVVDMFIVQGNGNALTGSLRVGIFAADTTLQPTGSCLAQAEIPYTLVATLYTKQLAPVTLTPGVYLIAFNVTTASSWTRGAGGISPLSSVLGANMFSSRIFASSQTMSGDYTTGPPWNSKTDGTTPHIHATFLRWKAA